MGQRTRDIYATRVRRRHYARIAFDVFVFVAFWAGVTYLALW